jgi:ABC-2 type transport system permease protein
MTGKRIWAVMRAEFLHIIRDPISLIISLAMPLFMLFLVAYCMCFEFKELPLAVFDMDQSVESKDYIRLIDHSSYFDIKYYLTRYDQAENMLVRGKTRGVIIIPSTFSREVKKYRPANIQTLVDGSDVNIATFLANYLSAINASRSIEMATEFINKNGLTVDLDPVVLSARTWYNQSLREFTYMITGTFSQSILGFVPILCALAIVREKESGSIQQIFASPIQSYEYIAGKMSPYVILLTVDFIIIIIFALWWFALPFRGSFITLCVATFLMVFACVSIGFFISTLTKSQLTAMLLGIIFTLMPSFIFADTLCPLDYSPASARFASCFFPGRFYTTICRAEILKGSSILDYWENALSLVVYCIAIFSICALVVKNKKI